jgi:SCP-2 sterol transfer family
MDERGDSAATNLERYGRLAPFSDFSAPLPRLVEPASYEVDATFARLADMVGAPEEALSVGFRVVDDDGERVWTLNVGPSGGRVATQASEEGADLEFIVQADTWRRIAEGTMSLLEAFGRGQLRVRGDIEDARRFAVLLSHRGR